MKIDLSGKKYLIGIDPGFDNLGVCIYNPETNNMRLFGGDWFDGLEFIGQVDLRKAVVVMENPALDSATFKALGMVKPIVVLYGNYMKKVGAQTWPLPNKVDWPEVASKVSIALRVASNIGENKAAGKLMAKLLKRHKVPTIQIAPSDRMRADKTRVPIANMTFPTKTNRNQFKVLTGYEGRSNEHSRDGATLVWGKSFDWAANMLLIGVQDKAKKTRAKSKAKKKTTPKPVPKQERKFFNVHDKSKPGQRVEKVNGKFVFVED